MSGFRLILSSLLKFSVAKLCILATFIATLLLSSIAQSQSLPPSPGNPEMDSYNPSGAVFTDSKKFPYESDKRVAVQALDTMQKFKLATGIGASISELLGWRDKDGKFDNEWLAKANFPAWACGNKDTHADWVNDSIRIMFGSTSSLNLAYILGCMNMKTSLDWPRSTAHLKILIYQDVTTGMSCYLHTYGPDPNPLLLTHGVRGNGFKGDITPEHLSDKGCCPSNKDVMEICDIKKNGYHVELLWPTHQVALNDFGMYSFDPTYECNNEWMRQGGFGNDNEGYEDYLTKLFLQRHGIADEKNEPPYPTGLRSFPHRGQTAWGGMQPGEQFYHQEAHVYQTYLAHFAQINRPVAANYGYDEGAWNCFFNGVHDRDQRIVTTFTESMPYLPLWRTEELSSNLDYALYRISVPRPTATSTAQFMSSGMSNYYKGLNLTFAHTKTCANYRLARWPGELDQGVPLCYNFTQFTGPRENRYGDLATTLGIAPMPGIVPTVQFDCGGSVKYADTGAETPEMVRYSQVCMRGGGELYPITGKLMGHFSELPAAAILARRAFQLVSHPGNPDAVRMNRFSDNFDKMQRIYPLYPPDETNGANSPYKGAENGFVSQCYRTSEIPNYLSPSDNAGYTREGDFDWPKDAIRPEQLGEKRFVAWERKRVCMCPKMGQAIATKVTCGWGSAQFDTGANYCQRMNEPSCMSPSPGDLDETEVVWRTDGVSYGYVGWGVPYTEYGFPEGIPFPFITSSGGGPQGSVRPSWCGSSIRPDPSKYGSFCADLPKGP